MFSRADRLAHLIDAQERTRTMARSYAEHGLHVPQLPIVNPPLWEFGHVAWFTEFWVLRTLLDRAPLRDDGDALYDSAKVAHATRWSLPLPSFERTARYASEIYERAGAELARRDDDAARYFGMLAVLHEDMHGEAALMTAQTLRRPWPLPIEVVPETVPSVSGDVHIPAGRYRLGADPAVDAFVFDNEKWAHDVDLASFQMARAPVTNAEYAAFVAGGGPVPRDWVRGPAGSWLRHTFDRLVPLRPHAPVCNVSRNEAEAYCRWAGRRLPTEAEWEIAATYDFATGAKRRFPWGDDPPTPERAHLDARGCEPLDAGALPGGDTPAGLRQMIGNVWEWTATTFAPYPGFVRDPYKEYSEPWFGDHAVLRGGAWTTRSRLIRGTWRNFYRPDRRDAFAGFRTCA